MKRKCSPVIGLLTAKAVEIEELKRNHPGGEHLTHKRDGTRLPFNGVFCIEKRRFK
jgi:hypothetical protein